MKRYRLLPLFLCLLLTTGCQNISSTATAETETETETEIPETETEEPQTEPVLSKEVRAITDALEAASQQSSFQLQTTAEFNLNGSSINGSYHLHSDIHIVQDPEHKNLQMTSVSSSDIDEIISRAWYRDGWYYSDNGTEKDKTEKSPEDVLLKVTEISDLVLGAADKIENVTVTEKENLTVYTYQIPLYLAELYLEKIIAGDAVKDTPIAGAEATLTELSLSSSLNPDGLLVHQKLKLSGKVHKVIFTVPAEVTISSDFSQTDDRQLEMELW